MAENYLPLENYDLDQLLRILWGNEVNPEIFRRWSQGFVFSEHEPSALVQFDGGPCSVIASVEAFLLKNLIFICSPKPNWRQLTSAEQNTLLCSSLCDIFQQVADSGPFQLVLVAVDVCESGDVENDFARIGKFHNELRIRSFSDLSSLQTELISNLQLFGGIYGCILFLYSLLFTKVEQILISEYLFLLNESLKIFIKGLAKVKEEIGDVDESLIDSVHGHGTQSLINLLLTGKAVSYVWDNVKEVSGLKLIGISVKSQVGFLTLLEHLRYCEVGWFLKNPHYPIWVLGSETHLTVLFSEDKSLVGEEGPEAVAQRVFCQFDKEARGFISSGALIDVMRSLDLFADPEYVKIMLAKLDPEQLGIVTLNDFLEEFFPRKNSDHSCHKFLVYHYNGLQRSCANNQVTYCEAVCSIKDLPELQMISDFSPIKTCLLTKWPTIEITWKNNVIPSLN